MSRPAIEKAGSSSSIGLAGLERAVPSFQTFSKRTPPPRSPVDQYKPLPPTPLRRRSSFIPTLRPFPSARVLRRASSIYSRPASEWCSVEVPITASALLDHPLPPFDPAFLQAPADPLPDTSSDLEVLLPRTYSPLIATPSTVASRGRTPSPTPFLDSEAPRDPSPPVPLPLPITRSKIPRDHLRTVPLEKAKLVINAPGSEHLLPEELRARATAQANLRKKIVDVAKPIADPSSSLRQHWPVTQIENLISQRIPSINMFVPKTFDEFDFAAAGHARTESDERHERNACVSPFSPASRNPSVPGDTFAPDHHRNQDTKTLQVPHSSYFDEPQRGRTKSRALRNSRGQRIDQLQPTSKEIVLSRWEKANDVAAQYLSLLSPASDSESSDPSRSRSHVGSGSPSPARSHQSVDSVASHMRLAPQPLFGFKPSARGPGSVRRAKRISTSSSNSPGFQQLRDSSSVTADVTDGSSYESDHSPARAKLETSFSLDDLTEAVVLRKMPLGNSSGSIPISPPSPTYPKTPIHNPVSAAPVLPEPSPRICAVRPQIKTRDSGFAGLFGFFKKRQGPKPSEAPTGCEADKPGTSRPYVANHNTVSPTDTVDQVISQYSHNNNDSQAASPTREQHDNTNTNKPADVLQRVAHGAVRVADILTRPAGYPSTPSDSPEGIRSPRPSSPANRFSTGPLRLGWTEASKEDFDASKPVTHKPRLGRMANHSKTSSESAPTKQTFVHVAAPARPLDTRVRGITEDSILTVGEKAQRSSLFGNMLESRMEKGQEKKREEIKKSIRHIANEDSLAAPASPGPRSASMEVETEGAGGIERPPASFWGSRKSDFGLKLV